jgi:hypothetical protein
MSNPFLGSWRILEMELWERDDIDMLRLGYIQFNRDGTGEFGFMAVQGEMDCRVGERDGRPIVEFSWSGCEEMEQSAVEDGTLMTDCAAGSSFISATTPPLPLASKARKPRARRMSA